MAATVGARLGQDQIFPQEGVAWIATLFDLEHAADDAGETTQGHRTA